MHTLFRVLAVFSLITLVGAGCGASAPRQEASSDSPSPTTQVGSTEPAPRGDDSACFNLYYPLKAGSAITYRMTSADMDVPVTIRVTERTESTVKLEYTFTVRGQEAKVTNELVCESGTIKGKGFFDFAQAFTGLDISYDTISMDGEILPHDLAVGREWDLTTEVEIHTNNERMRAMLDGRRQKTVIASKVVGEERVTVPAGTYDALKIEQVITIDTSVMGVSATTTANAWYAKDVGLVKSENRSGSSVFSMEATEVVQE